MAWHGNIPGSIKASSRSQQHENHPFLACTRLPQALLELQGRVGGQGSAWFDAIKMTLLSSNSTKS
jgi:hypothetical protein